MTKMTLKLIEEHKLATKNAQDVLCVGDKIRASRCGGIKSTYTFLRWENDFIVSKSGIDDISALNIDRLNGRPVNFLYFT